MLFNSREFILFFPIIAITFFALPHRHRWWLLLVASYFFYMSWRIEYGLLLLFVSLVAYSTGLLIARYERPDIRRFILLVGVFVSLLPLFMYKYSSFFSANMAVLSQQVGLDLDLPVIGFLLPIGISFYTFQALSYVIDIYRGARSPERHFGIFTLYVSFFPQLVAGPIERSTHLLPQFRREVAFDAIRIASGLRLMLWGLFKKMVVADNLSPVVDHVYSDPTAFSGLAICIATVFFAVQIFCDFSGYADMAIGSARILGIDLMINFDRPYGAHSIGEFWRRWHISLSTWLRDYIYIPLGGNRAALGRHMANLVIVFLVSGLWHGAAWHFVVWGGIYGGLLVISHLTHRIRDRFNTVVGLNRLPTLKSAVQIAVALALVNLAWVFFRAESLSEALVLVSRIFTQFGTLTLDMKLLFPFAGLNTISEIGILVGLVACIICVVSHIWGEPRAIEGAIVRLPVYIRWSGYYALLLAILFLGPTEAIEFIYFQF